MPATVASRRESHALSHFEISPSVCSHTWKIPDATLTIAHSQKQLRIRYTVLAKYSEKAICENAAGYFLRVRTGDERIFPV